jgi:hypothetical protein
MNLKEKYQEDYILLACLRQYVEKGIILASVNFWRDSIQQYREFEMVQKRSDLLTAAYRANEFVTAFCEEEFPEIDDRIPDDIVNVSMFIIEKGEGPETLRLIKHFLLDYAIAIANSSTEDWLAFAGLKDSISDSEELFLDRLRTRLQISS